MKKLLSLLVLAFTAMSAWGYIVSFTPDVITGNSSGANMPDTMSLDGVTITCDLAGFNAGSSTNKHYRFAAYSTTQIVSTVGKITKVTFTSTGGSYGAGNFSGEGFSGGIWSGRADTISLYASHQVRATKIDVTIEDPTTELTEPQFYPSGGTFNDSLEVAILCNTINAEIHYIEGSNEDNFDWTTHTIYSGPFTLTSSKTITAWAELNGERSNYVTTTFTRNTPTLEPPVFTPNSCNFEDSLKVALESENPNAVIYYSYDCQQWFEYSDTILIYDNTAIFAKAILQDPEYGTIESLVSSAGYSKIDDSGTRVVLFPSNYGYVYEAAVPYTLERDGVSFTVSRGNIRNSFRIHKGQNIYFSAAQGNITKIEFVCENSDDYGYNPSLLELNEGQNGSYSYTQYSNVGTWNGYAPRVSFNTNKGQERCYLIRVYIDGEIPEFTVDAPQFTPENDTTLFVYRQEVALSCPTPGATIYYSTDYLNWTQYTEPFDVTDSCTLIAFAQLDGVNSLLGFRTFFRAKEVNNLAEANALSHHTLFGFNGEVIVTFQNGANTWVKDDSGYGLIYGEDVPRFPQGTVIKPGWDGDRTDYYTVPEFMYPHNVEASGQIVPVSPNEYTTVTTDNFNEYVLIKNQTLTPYIYDNKMWQGSSGQLFYNRFTDLGIVLEEGVAYDIVGIVAYRNKKVEIYICSATEVYDWQLGDVNHSKTVDIDDVTLLISRVLGTNTGEFYEEQANCDGLGGIDIDDVTALISRVLTGSW